MQWCPGARRPKGLKLMPSSFGFHRMSSPCARGATVPPPVAASPSCAQPRIRIYLIIGVPGRLDANGGQQGGQRVHPHIVYLWHDADRVRTCPSGYGHLATCDETDPKKQPPISHEKCPKVHDMWVKSVAAHPPFPGIFSCHLVTCSTIRGGIGAHCVS